MKYPLACGVKRELDNLLTDFKMNFVTCPISQRQLMTLESMRNLECYTEIIDSNGRAFYRIWSHRELTDKERYAVLEKKSLHVDDGLKKLRGYVGLYKFVKIVAADGWEQAE